jgi:hypothetical protein
MADSWKGRYTVGLAWNSERKVGLRLRLAQRKCRAVDACRPALAHVGRHRLTPLAVPPLFIVSLTLLQAHHAVAMTCPPPQGEVMITAGDKPPALGAHVYRSADGGESWDDVTETVFGTPELAEVGALILRKW